MNVPKGTHPATGEQRIDLANYSGQWLVLYFYPKDATPGCTLEGQDFRDAYAKFQSLNTEIIGISRDNIACHQRFKDKQQFPFPLISDSDETLCNHFEVIKDKMLYGKAYRGIERSTFLVGPDGMIRHEWRKVKVAGHVAAVLSKLLDMQA